ncbi:MAG: hypothetical protein K9G41_05595 [Flavobacteriales bacterium]|nr:hypothetical protein [Flavobacteriales bacterium]
MASSVYCFGMVLLLELASCSNPIPTHEPTVVDSLIIQNDMPEGVATPKDTTVSPITESPPTTVKTVSKKPKVESLATRYLEFPGDAHWNGKSVVQQIDLEQRLLEAFPDTLKNLALHRYSEYKEFYPVSIADDFENHISTEHIHYPSKLIFRFQMFENEYHAKPYSFQDIVVKRTPEGEFYVE